MWVFFYRKADVVTFVFLKIRMSQSGEFSFQMARISGG